VLCDVDLVILVSLFNRYVMYIVDVCREYVIVLDDVFCVGCFELLCGLLACL